MTQAKLQWTIGHPDAVPLVLKPHLENAQRMIDQIADRARELANSNLPQPTGSESNGPSTFVKLSPVDNENTLNILGDRGSGKTTLIEFLCATLLQQPDRLVLPIIRPEQFSKHDTIAGWALASVMQMCQDGKIGTSKRRFSVDNVEYSLEQWTASLQQQEALASLPELQQWGGLSLASIARDTTTLNSQGITFSTNWRLLIDQLLNDLEASNRDASLVILPVDDADLVADKIPRILDELRRLAHPNLVTIFAAKEETAVLSLLAHSFSTTYGSLPQTKIFERHLDESTILEGIHKRLAKALPSHLRIEIRALTLRQRLDFRPVRQDEPFIQVLSRIEVDSLPFIKSLADLFVFASPGHTSSETGGDPSDYCDCLPSSARDLSHLYAELQRVVGNPTGEHSVAAQGARVIIDHALRLAIPHVSKEYEDTLEWSDRGRALGFRLEFRGLRFEHGYGMGIVVRRTQQTVDGGGTSASIGVVNNIRSVHKSRAQFTVSDGRAGEEPQTSTLPDGYTHALYLLNELSRDDADVLLHLGQRQQVERLGGTHWVKYLHVTFDEVDTDDDYWLIPNWSTHFDYFLYANGWNRMWDTVISIPGAGPSDDDRIEWCFLTHLELVVATQAARRTVELDAIPQHGPGVAVNGGQPAWADQRAGRQRMLQDAFANLYAKSLELTATVRDREFRIWFETLLPWAADTVCVSAEMRTWILETREAIVRQHGDTFRPNLRAAELLSRRIRGRLRAKWWTSAIETLQTLNASIGREIAARWEGEKALQSREFEEELSSLAARGVAPEVLLRLRAFGLNRTMREELLAARLSAEYVDTLTARFSGSSGSPASSSGVRPAPEGAH